MATRICIILTQSKTWQADFFSTLIPDKDVEYLKEARLVDGGPSFLISTTSPTKRKRTDPGTMESDVLPGVIALEATATVPRHRRTLNRAAKSARATQSVRNATPSDTSGSESDLVGSDIDVVDNNYQSVLSD